MKKQEVFESNITENEIVKLDYKQQNSNIRSSIQNLSILQSINVYENEDPQYDVQSKYQQDLTSQKNVEQENKRSSLSKAQRLSKNIILKRGSQKVRQSLLQENQAIDQIENLSLFTANQIKTTVNNTNGNISKIFKEDAKSTESIEDASMRRNSNKSGASRTSKNSKNSKNLKHIYKKQQALNVNNEKKSRSRSTKNVNNPNLAAIKGS